MDFRGSPGTACANQVRLFLHGVAYMAALDLPEPHAEAPALAPVRHPAQQADQARHRGHRNGRSHSHRPGPGGPGRGYPHPRLDAPRPVRHLSAGPCARTQEPVPATPNPPPHPAASSRHRDPAARKVENLKLNYREKIALSAPLVNNPGYVPEGRKSLSKIQRVEHDK